MNRQRVRRFVAVTGVVAVLLLAMAIVRGRPPSGRLAGRLDEHDDGRTPVDETISASVARERAAMAAELGRGDVAAYAAHFANDAVAIDRAGASVRGRIAIETATLEALRSLSFANVSFRPNTVVTVGDRVREDGEVWFEATVNRSSRRFGGAYVALWRWTGSRWLVTMEATRSLEGDVV